MNGTVGIVIGFGVSTYDDDEGVKEEEDEAQQKKKLKFAAAVGAGTAELAPIIDWRTPTGIERQVSAREDWRVDNQKGEKQATRKQVRDSRMSAQRSKLTSLLRSTLSSCLSALFRFIRDWSTDCLRLFLEYSAWAMRYAVSSVWSESIS